MKIGILSMQKIPNYGSFLQALSLKMQLEQRGHDVYFVDILPGKQIVSAQASASDSMLKKLDKYALKRIENYLLHRRMCKIHTEDQIAYLQTEKQLPDGSKFDLVIIGSDEVFNATVPSGWGFSQQLFGKVENTDRVVTYAASCGSTTYDSAAQYGIIPELRDAMKNLGSLSVRDYNTEDFVRRITGREAERHVDPVFLSDFDPFIPQVSKRKPYLLVYAYPNRICQEEEIFAIRKYAKAHGLDIVSVGMQQRWCKHNIPATGFELLGYVKNAACVVTDTFHGTVFSIKYNKKFVSLIRDSNSNKLGGLLKQFDLYNRAVKDNRSLTHIMDTSIDYDAVNNRIRQEQQKAYAYLDRITGE